MKSTIPVMLSLLLLATGCSSPSAPPSFPAQPAEESVSNVETEAVAITPAAEKAPASGINDEKVTLTLLQTYTGFQSPTGIAVNDDGDLFVSNWGGGTIVRVDSSGNQSVFSDAAATPSGLAFDAEGNLYAGDYSGDVVYKLAKDGTSSIFADGFHTPTGIAFNAQGDLLVSNRASNEIVQVNPNGQKTIIAEGLRTPVGVVEAADGSLYVMNYGGGVIRVTADGNQEYTDDFDGPGVGIAKTSQNHLFGVDNGIGGVRQFTSDGHANTVIEGIGGCVALLIQDDKLYVGGWSDGTVSVYIIG